MVNKIIAFDLDDVICCRTSNHGGIEKYKTCYPNREMIHLVNTCYRKGAIIKIYTARGMTHFSGDVNKIYSNLYNLTLDQLENWGVMFHELLMGKLHYDLLIDDKALNSLNVSFEKIKSMGEE